MRHRFLPALAALLAVATDRDRLEREALDAEALRRSDLVKTALLRAVSHDLRSPLTGVRTAVGALRNTSLHLSDEDRADLLETIAVDSERLQRLVGDLLDLSRLEAGGAAPEQERVVARRPRPGVGRRRSARATASSVVGEAPLVDVDAVQIQRVLANLIENALKYSPRRRRTSLVRITATRKEAIVRVVDQGPGLPEAELERVFEPFYRRERRHALRRRARSRDRARLRRSERRPRVGRVQAGAGCDLRACAAGRRGARGAAGMNGQRVLVVDDEPQILRALRTTLRGAGYTVDSAATATEALTAAAAHPPEAVILDLVLPDGNGTDVCRELRSWSDAPVIVLSAVGEERQKIAALDAGADDYVTKPFGVDELLARLRAVLRRRGAEQPEPVLEIGDLRIDVPQRIVTVRGARVKLSPHEFDLLRVLAQHRGKLLTHRALLTRGVGAVVPGRGALPPRVRLAPAQEDRARSVAARATS